MTNQDRKKKLKWQLPFLALLIIGTIYIIKNHHETPYQKNEGMIFGTIYHLTYQCDSSLQNEIVSELQKVDHSLSPFNKESIITRVNNNDSVLLDSMFLDVFNLAKEISKNTDGAFDITVAPLVNAWGFGFKNTDSISQNAIDSMLQFVGFNKVWIENGKIVKAEAETGQAFLNAMLDMDEGSRFIGEIAIGTNDEIQEITGSILFDEKIGGSIHMAAGASYPETGGKNVSGLHWDMIKNMKQGGKIYADDVLIYENGKFLI